MTALDVSVTVAGLCFLWIGAYHYGAHGKALLIGGALATFLLLGNAQLRSRGSSSAMLVPGLIMIAAVLANGISVPDPQRSRFEFVLIAGAFLLDIGWIFLMNRVLRLRD